MKRKLSLLLAMVMGAQTDEYIKPIIEAYERRDKIKGLGLLPTDTNIISLDACGRINKNKREA